MMAKSVKSDESMFDVGRFHLGKSGRFQNEFPTEVTETFAPAKKTALAGG
ncbi:hypothetical protein [Pseudomonas sp. NPDC087817]